ncbi:hypothetical protein CEXT_708391 [Caerostris extrusa]|uniref:Uncharacterized protein n=1 Tax=Caerostris extrusa TaxID=172846 RepID=A0AAV4SYW6_CAEEX|nr:hypothetical protein CEXT_708391 [Caerostris extrusa]
MNPIHVATENFCLVLPAKEKKIISDQSVPHLSKQFNQKSFTIASAVSASPTIEVLFPTRLLSRHSCFPLSQTEALEFNKTLPLPSTHPHKAHYYSLLYFH